MTTTFAIKRANYERVKTLKAIIKKMLWAALSFVVVMLLCNLVVVEETKNKIFFDPTTIPSNDVGLVLGTSKSVAKGKENLFFKYRMEATARLFKEGKIKYLILSGNKEEFYDEPKDMKIALIRLDLPANVMILDTAGYRTYDSVVRCKKVFKQNNVTIISQNFHNARALYICQHEGISAIGFAAQDVPDGYSVKTLLREYLARPKSDD